jgi:large repetitive protein
VHTSARNAGRTAYPERLRPRYPQMEVCDLRKTILGVLLVLATAGLVGAFASSASAYPTLTSPCSNCHSGANVPVAATLATNVGGTATYNVSAPGASAIAVFSGSTKLTTISAASGSFSVADGATYTVYAVTGPTTSDGIGSTAVSPVAPPADTTAPVTKSDAAATYVSSATIHLTATDNIGVAHTYYILDGAAQVEGTTVSVSTAGSHTLTFWSVDAAGNKEIATTLSFAITVPAPVDTVAPVTTSDAKATYVSSAVIKLSATDNVGVAHTYYTLDGAGQVEGTSVTVGTAGSHTLTFWSVDAAGNTETATTVTFSIVAPAATGGTDGHHHGRHHHSRHFSRHVESSDAHTMRGWMR